MRPGAAYRWLLLLLPAQLRTKHGAEMEAAFVEALEGAHSEGRAFGTVRTWTAGILDILYQAVVGRLRRPFAAWNRGRRAASVDLRFALRGFTRRPGLTILAVAMLSLGVAATSAVFTLVDGMFLRPLPFRDPGRLIYINETAPAWGLEHTGINFRDFDTWRGRTQAFEAMGLFSITSHNLAGEERPERVAGAEVTWDLAAALGIEPPLGRLFTAEDDRPGAEPVVMLGHDLWRSGFGAAEDVVGQMLHVDGVPATIVGVLPPEARFPGDAQIWRPLGLDVVEDGDGWAYQGIGRLRPGVTAGAAEADLIRAHEPIWETFDPDRIVSPITMPLRSMLVADFRGVALALGLAVASLLLIACANVASILLARSFARRREMAVRLALGAGTGRLAGQLLGESLVLAVVAGPLGVLMGYWAVGLLAAVAPPLPTWMEMAPSWRLAMFGLAAIGVTTVLFGWAPMLQTRRESLQEGLREGGPRSGGSRTQRRLMDGLVVAEITLAVLLLVGGGLLFRTFDGLHNQDPGFRTEDVLHFRVALPDATYPDSSARVAFYSGLTERLQRIPGVRAVGGITCPPLGCHAGAFFMAEDGLGIHPDDANPVVLYRFATPGYFPAMGIQAVQGELLEEGMARLEGRRPIVVNETFARRFFPDTDDPVGKLVAFRGQDLEESGMRVVGVARDVKHYGVDQVMRPAVYLPYGSLTAVNALPPPSLAVFLWTAVEPTSVTTAVRDVVRSSDPALPIFELGTVAQTFRDSLAARRAVAWLMMVLAGLALVLALGGIYGVLSYVVGQRLREIGLRAALGATRAGLLRLVFRQGLALTAVGLGFGLLGAVFGGVVLGSLLVGVSPFDPLTFLVVAMVVTGASCLATLVPARRALRVEPGVVLRLE